MKQSIIVEVEKLARINKFKADQDVKDYLKEATQVTKTKADQIAKDDRITKEAEIKKAEEMDLLMSVNQIKL